MELNHKRTRADASGCERMRADASGCERMQAAGAEGERTENFTCISLNCKRIRPRFTNPHAYDSKRKQTASKCFPNRNSYGNLIFSTIYTI